jgi:guanine deaminase
MDIERLMRLVIDEAKRGIASGQSPFGAVIATLAGHLICTAHNTVRASCDATAHAEINAIRDACTKLRTIDLSGHVILTTCEPCPMCAAAIHWARLDQVIYGATIEDAGQAGFRELSVSCRSLYERGGSEVQVRSGILSDPCRALFDEWQRGGAPTPY